MPFGIARHCVGIDMVTHETSDVGECIHVTLAELAMFEQPVLVPRPEGGITDFKDLLDLIGREELLFLLFSALLLQLLRSGSLSLLYQFFCKLSKIFWLDDKHDAIAIIDDILYIHLL